MRRTCAGVPPCQRGRRTEGSNRPTSGAV